MRSWLRAILLVGLCCSARAAPPASQPTDPKLWQEMTEIDQRVGRIQDFSAEFTQRKFTPLLKKPLTSSGHVLGKGDRTLWITEKPEATKMLVDAEGISIYYPEQNLEEIYPIEGQLGALASSPLPRIKTLKDFFSFQRMNAREVEPSANDDANLAVRMLPTDETLKQHVQEVKVLLDRKSGFIVRAENTDADGERTVLTFSNVKVDTGLAEDSLRLQIPPDARVSHPLESMEGGK